MANPDQEPINHGFLDKEFISGGIGTTILQELEVKVKNCLVTQVEQQGTSQRPPPGETY